ncbi:hypothetical protein SCOCK_830014 [Actinacidiphila cocklensis]|uniref:Uncharacterized protein n=1 Tax=Actinacidiphila cocklensis TaxID=887465 RepID=A0A9W4DX26_9ACTN|nr:hypothetical protein SCOCK_830014 [Actinacidiphila cocklensis]
MAQQDRLRRHHLPDHAVADDPGLRPVAAPRCGWGVRRITGGGMGCHDRSRRSSYEYEHQPEHLRPRRPAAQPDDHTRRLHRHHPDGADRPLP